MKNSILLLLLATAVCGLSFRADQADTIETDDTAVIYVYLGSQPAGVFVVRLQSDRQALVGKVLLNH